MMIHEVTALVGKYKARKRVGRGEASGHGKTSGRGHKGAKSRSGYSAKRGYEGGQMPFFRRIAQRGFTNAPFKTEFWIVNLCDIVAHPAFAKGGSVNAEKLVAAGLIPDDSRPVKVLGDTGKSKSLSVKLDLAVERVSDSARKLVSGAGGSVAEAGTRRDKVRGVDRNGSDRTPKNLTKKPKNRAAKKFDGKDKKGGKKGGGDKATVESAENAG
ncbi:MAG: 50S ribosomal protein L15 [Phycisphaerales bacterium]|nr:50S ribosomal protein L15 [Phycisphaerales bacterium]